MTETKEQKFERVAAPRLQNVSKSLGLLHNLARSEYNATPERKAEIVQRFRAELDGLAEAWGVDDKPTPKPKPVMTRAAEAIAQIGLGLSTKADGGASVESEVRWAVDLIAKGDYETAINRLKRCLQ